MDPCASPLPKEQCSSRVLVFAVLLAPPHLLPDQAQARGKIAVAGWHLVGRHPALTPSRPCRKGRLIRLCDGRTSFWTMMTMSWRQKCKGAESSQVTACRGDCTENEFSPHRFLCMDPWTTMMKTRNQPLLKMLVNRAKDSSPSGTTRLRGATSACHPASGNEFLAHPPLLRPGLSATQGTETDGWRTWEG